MSPEERYRHYQELQRYVGWTEADAERLRVLPPLVELSFPSLIDDFYAEIERHEATRRVITGGEEQIARLKSTLLGWIRDLFSGTYDDAYVTRRWRVGWRHVDIELEQIYVSMALSRLRSGLLRAIETAWTADGETLHATLRSLDKLLDLDLAIIDSAYQAESAARQQITERLAAIGQLAGGLAHELRNPLNVIKTSVYYLLHARNPSPEKRTEHLQRIERQVGLADGVITALSNFARMPNPEARSFSPVLCASELLESQPPPETVEVSLDFPASLPAAQADVEQIRIALRNLVSNAVDAMPEGGRLTLAGRHLGDTVELQVRDTGTGIAPEDLHRIMEPLFTTKVRGLGLGLALSRAIVEKNGGLLRVASEPGRGSTFTLRLPAARSGG